MKLRLCHTHFEVSNIGVVGLGSFLNSSALFLAQNEALSVLNYV